MDFLGVRAGVGAVAARYFAADDRRFQGLFGAVIRRRYARIEQAYEPFRRVVGEMLGEFAVVLVGTCLLYTSPSPRDCS